MCEGASDAAFLCLYVEKKLGYVEDRKAGSTYRSSIFNSFFRLMKGQNRDLLVCSCAGCNNIGTIYRDFVLPSAKTNGQDFRVMVMIDRDNKTDAECFALTPFAEITLQINSWLGGTIQGDFIQPDGNFNTINYKSFFGVIPDSSFGAFENVLINSINTNHPDIVNEVNTFYTGLSPNARANIQTNRLEIKAKLDTMIILLNPESIFLTIRNLFQIIDLNDANIVSNFSFIDDIINPV